MVAADGSRLVSTRARRPRCELRLTEQTLVRRVTDERITLCLLDKGMTELNVDDGCPFKTMEATG